MNPIPAGKGRLFLLFDNRHSLEKCLNLFDLVNDPDDIQAHIAHINIGPTMHYVLRVERRMPPFDIGKDAMRHMVAGIWRDCAAHVYREQNDGPLIEIKHTGPDQEETLKIINILLSINTPIYKGRMGHPPLSGESRNAY